MFGPCGKVFLDLKCLAFVDYVHTELHADYLWMWGKGQKLMYFEIQLI